VLAAVLYFGLYKFVGSFGAGTLVDSLQNTVFGEYLLPPVESAVRAVVPWPALADSRDGRLRDHQPGPSLRRGHRPARSSGPFFLAFFSGVWRTSGYLPRLAMLLDRLFKKIGLTGRAVIPLVLGLGCDTMAVLVTRTLETRREKVIAALLLALAVAVLGADGGDTGLLGSHPAGLVVWGAVIVGRLQSPAGFLAAPISAGDPPSFYMELPPAPPAAPGQRPHQDLLAGWSGTSRRCCRCLSWPDVLIWLGQITGLFPAPGGRLGSRGPLARSARRRGGGVFVRVLRRGLRGGGTL